MCAFIHFTLFGINSDWEKNFRFDIERQIVWHWMNAKAMISQVKSAKSMDLQCKFYIGKRISFFAASEIKVSFLLIHTEKLAKAIFNYCTVMYSYFLPSPFQMFRFALKIFETHKFASLQTLACIVLCSTCSTNATKQFLFSLCVQCSLLTLPGLNIWCYFSLALQIKSFPWDFFALSVLFGKFFFDKQKKNRKKILEIFVFWLW